MIGAFENNPSRIQPDRPFKHEMAGYCRIRQVSIAAIYLDTGKSVTRQEAAGYCGNRDLNRDGLEIRGHRHPLSAGGKLALNT